MKGEGGETKSLLVACGAGAAVWMDAGSCVILPTTADLFHCECFPVRTGNIPRKGKKWGGDESQSRWTVFRGGGGGG